MATVLTSNCAGEGSRSQTTAALLFTAYIVPVNLMDNVLKPIVMGRGLQTPMLVILIGVIGGSFMTGEALWVVIGAITVFLGGSLVVGSRRS